MPGRNAKVLCQCSGDLCDKRIIIPIEKAMDLKRRGFFHVSAECIYGPGENYVFVESGVGYNAYKEVVVVDVNP